MKSSVVLWLTWKRLWHFKGRSFILIACLGATLFLPWAASGLLHDYRLRLTKRADDTPLVMGALGNRFDLAFTALYFRRSGLAAVPWPALQELNDAAMGVAVPIHVGFTARGVPLVGTSPEYFEQRHLRVAEGTIPVGLGEVILGFNAARRWQLGSGDTIFSDLRELYDISLPPALKMHISGVLAPSGSVDDDAVFVDVATCWILEGLMHGHQQAETVDPALVLGADAAGDHMVLSKALIEYNEITPENATSYHDHGDPEHLPLSAILFWPDSAKSSTLIRSRINQQGVFSMLAPRAVVDDLLGYAFRIKRVFDGVAWTLGVVTLALTLLVFALSERLRTAEMRALDRIGVSAALAWRLRFLEFLCVLGAAAVLAFLAVAAVRDLVPRWIGLSS